MSVISQFTAAKLMKGNTPAEIVTCAVASTDYPGAVIPLTCRYITVYASASCVVALGEATDATHGIGVGANLPVTFPVPQRMPGQVDDDFKPHAQSATGGCTVRFTYQSDA